MIPEKMESDFETAGDVRKAYRPVFGIQALRF
jgi:hypothetical protein